MVCDNCKEICARFSSDFCLICARFSSDFLYGSATFSSDFLLQRENNYTKDNDFDAFLLIKTENLMRQKTL